MHTPRPKLLLVLSASALLLGFASCSKESASPTPGDATFYNSQSSVPIITVTLNGASRTITVTSNTTPTCTSSTGTANFTSVPSGDYTYTASASGYTTRTGSITIAANQCNVFQVRM